MNYLPKHVTVPEACEWLATETGEPWTLARLLEHSLMPWVWLDYNPRFPKIFGNRFEGFLTPMLFYGDVVRLAAVGNGVLLTMIRTPDQPQENILVVPGLRGEIHDLRFLRDDITRLAGKHSKPEGTPGAKVEAAPATSLSGDEQTSPVDDADHTEKLAALFEPVPVEALEKMFPASGKWKNWVEKAKANRLIVARVGTAKFNPYRAGLWFVQKGAEGWDNARLYRTLANNLPARSLDSVHLLTGGID